MTTLARSKHRDLLDDPNFRRWYENVARGSLATAQELAQAPLRIDMIRPKTEVQFYSFIPEMFLTYLRDWLRVRKGIPGRTLEPGRRMDLKCPTRYFTTNYLNPADEGFTSNVHPLTEPMQSMNV